MNTIQHFFQNPTSVLEDVVVSVEAMGNLGFLYFGAVYTVAEILAIPAIPLTGKCHKHVSYLYLRFSSNMLVIHSIGWVSIWS